MASESQFLYRNAFLISYSSKFKKERVRWSMHSKEPRKSGMVTFDSSTEGQNLRHEAGGMINAPEFISGDSYLLF